MSYLVTGATHGLGRNAAEFLLSHQKNLIATGRSQQQGHLLSQQGAHFIPLDLMDKNNDVTPLFSAVEHVWHCAALSSDWGDYADFYQMNVVATRLLAEAAGKHKVKSFVHISSPSIYVDGQDNELISEDKIAAKFVNHYAHTKYLAEIEIQLKAKEYPETTFIILRPRAIFGPYDRVLLPKILKLLQDNKGKLLLPNGGLTLMDLTYVENVVHAMHLASNTTNLATGSAYNITNNDPQLLVDVLSQLLDRLNIEYRIGKIPTGLLTVIASLAEFKSKLSSKAPMITRYGVMALACRMTLDTQKAQQELNYQPLYSLQEGIDKTAAWLLNQE